MTKCKKWEIIFPDGHKELTNYNPIKVKEDIIKEYEKYLDDYKKEQRELVRQEVLEMIDEKLIMFDAHIDVCGVKEIINEFKQLKKELSA